jgi:hypothetical protein
MTYCHSCIVLDFDGTLTKSPGWCDYSIADIDTELITECQARGYAVAVSTCSVVTQVAGALNSRGISAWADVKMAHGEWHDGSVVLVSNRKVRGALMLDDRAMCWWYQREHRDIWYELERRENLQRSGRTY